MKGADYFWGAGCDRGVGMRDACGLCLIVEEKGGRDCVASHGRKEECSFLYSYLCAKNRHLLWNSPGGPMLRGIGSE